MAQNNGDFTPKECQAVMKYLFLKGNLAKKFTMICRLYQVISALPASQSRTVLLGLEQDI
jgi:hypothetical protein